MSRRRPSAPSGSSRSGRSISGRARLRAPRPLAPAVALLRGDRGARARASLEVACLAYLFTRLSAESPRRGPPSCGRSPARANKTDACGHLLRGVVNSPTPGSQTAAWLIIDQLDRAVTPQARQDALDRRIADP